MSLHRTASANTAGMPIVSVTQDIKDQKNFLLFHDGSNHDYHFIIKELAERFESQFECLRGNTEKYTIFSVSVIKETGKSTTITYKIKFFDRIRFMSSSLSSLAHNLSERLHKEKCKNCTFDLEYETAKPTH